MPYPVAAARGKNFGAPSFSPPNILGLQLWLDLSDLTVLFQDAARTTPVTADAQPIGGVADKSGLGNHASATLTTRPTYKANIQNGKSVARYDASDDTLSLGAMAVASGGYTIVAVHSGPAAIGGASSYLFDTQAGRLIAAHRSGGGNTWLAWYDGAWHNIDTTIEGWQVITWNLINGGNGTIYRNGTSLGSAAYTAMAIGTASAVGTKYDDTAPFFGGDIGEILIYSPDISASARTLLNSYLLTKWGITP